MSSPSRSGKVWVMYIVLSGTGTDRTGAVTQLIILRGKRSGVSGLDS